MPIKNRITLPPSDQKIVQPRDNWDMKRDAAVQKDARDNQFGKRRVSAHNQEKPQGFMKKAKAFLQKTGNTAAYLVKFAHDNLVVAGKFCYEFVTIKVPLASRKVVIKGELPDAHGLSEGTEQALNMLIGDNKKIPNYPSVGKGTPIGEELNPASISELKKGDIIFNIREKSGSRQGLHKFIFDAQNNFLGGARGISQNVIHTAIVVGIGADGHPLIAEMGATGIEISPINPNRPFVRAGLNDGILEDFTPAARQSVQAEIISTISDHKAKLETLLDGPKGAKLSVADRQHSQDILTGIDKLLAKAESGEQLTPQDFLDYQVDCLILNASKIDSYTLINFIFTAMHGTQMRYDENGNPIRFESQDPTKSKSICSQLIQFAYNNVLTILRPGYQELQRNEASLARENALNTSKEIIKNLPDLGDPQLNKDVTADLHKLTGMLGHDKPSRKTLPHIEVVMKKIEQAGLQQSGLLDSVANSPAYKLMLDLSQISENLRNADTHTRAAANYKDSADLIAPRPQFDAAVASPFLQVQGVYTPERLMIPTEDPLTLPKSQMGRVEANFITMADAFAKDQSSKSPKQSEDARLIFGQNVDVATTDGTDASIPLALVALPEELSAGARSLGRHFENKHVKNCFIKMTRAQYGTRAAKYVVREMNKDAKASGDKGLGFYKPSLRMKHLGKYLGILEMHKATNRSELVIATQKALGSAAAAALIERMDAKGVGDTNTLSRRARRAYIKLAFQER